MVMIMMVVVAMVMIKCSGLEKKKQKNKKVQGKCIIDRSFLFQNSRHQVGVNVSRIDSYTIKRGETRIKMRLSKCHQMF